MKDLYLKVRPEEGGIQSLGFDITWNDNNVVFDIADAYLQDDVQGLVIISASKINGELNSEAEFIRLRFSFKNNIETDIDFRVKNITAKNAEGRDVDIKMNITDYRKPEGLWNVDWLWKKQEL